MYVCMYGLVNLEIRGQFVGVSSFLPPCGSWGLNSAYQLLLLTKPSYGPWCSLHGPLCDLYMKSR